MFCQKEKTMQTIPPTQDALLQHIRRVTYQGGIWSTCEKSEQNLPTPEGWGWTFSKDSQSWTPVWITRPVASKACSELVKCGCKSKSGCSTRCVCKKAKWKCTELCSCNCETWKWHTEIHNHNPLYLSSRGSGYFTQLKTLKWYIQGDVWMKTNTVSLTVTESVKKTWIKRRT